MEIKRAFGLTLKRIRVKNGFTQEEIALEIDMARSYISYLERGVKEPSVTTLIRLCRALGIKPSEFMHKMELRLVKKS